MATVELTGDTFNATVEKQGIVFVDFWATWCAPCRAFAPVFEAAANRHTDLTFAKVNTEQERWLAGSLDIEAIPTLMIFRDGILVFAQPGALPASALEELIRKVRALDMDDVRRRVTHAAPHAP